MSAINWNITNRERTIIKQIVERAVKEEDKFCREFAAEFPNEKRPRPRFDGLSLQMDITAVHANGNPLRLAELRDADDFNFAHDIYGIVACINRNTGKLDKGFLPRFSEVYEALRQS